MLENEEWFVIDASWFRHWKAFIGSKRRMVPPGPIDNLWMVSSASSNLIEGLVEDTDDKEGDYRIVTPAVSILFLVSDFLRTCMQIWAIFEELYGGGPPISFIGPPAHDVSRWKVHFLGLNPSEYDYTEDWIEEFSDHESDVDSNDGVLHFDLQPGQQASLEDLMKIAELFGFDDGVEDADDNDDIRLINEEEGMGELYDMIDDPEQYVENLEIKRKVLARRASLLKKKKGPKHEETPEEREILLQHLIHRDFEEEESDSEASVDSWAEEIIAMHAAIRSA